MISGSCDAEMLQVSMSYGALLEHAENESLRMIENGRDE